MIEIVSKMCKMAIVVHRDQELFLFCDSVKDIGGLCLRLEKISSSTLSDEALA